MSNMVIKTNIPSLDAHRNIKKNDSNHATASARLSSGLRINSAADDAAGLAISEKMKAQIRGLNQARYNVEDGTNLCRTMDGGMDGIQDMMIRIRELIIQGLNDTNAPEDKAKIQLEINQLIDEIDCLAHRVEFNTIPLLCIPGDYTINILVDNKTEIIDAFEMIKKQYDGIMDDPGGTIARINNLIDTFINSPPNALTLNQIHNLALELYSVTIESENLHREKVNIMTGIIADETDDAFDPNLLFDYRQSVLYYSGPYGLGYNSTYARIMEGTQQALASDNPEYALRRLTYAFTGNENDLNAGQGARGIVFYHADIAIDARRLLGDMEIEITTPIYETHTITGDLHIQAGANSGQAIFISRYDCRAESLGIKELPVSPLEAGIRSLLDLDRAFGNVNEYRAKCGAQQNRLEYTGNSLSISSQNLDTARSRIEDADMAKEMMELVQTRVLQLSSIAMLAQANQLPHNVLQLLK